MYGSVTDAPRLEGRHGYLTVRYYKGKGRWISDDTPRYITQRVLYYTDADAIAEGLAELEEEYEEQAYEDLDWPDYDWGLADAYNKVLDAMFDEYSDVDHNDLVAKFMDDMDAWRDEFSEDMDVYADMFEEPIYDCDGPGMCHICTPGLTD